MSRTVKIVLNNDIRRLRVDLSAQDAFAQLLKTVAETYKDEIPASSELTIKYTDDEEEEITLSSHADLEEAFRVVEEDNRKSLKLFVSVSGLKGPKAPSTVTSLSIQTSLEPSVADDDDDDAVSNASSFVAVDEPVKTAVEESAPVSAVPLMEIRVPSSKTDISEVKVPSPKAVSVPLMEIKVPSPKVAEAFPEVKAEEQKQIFEEKLDVKFPLPSKEELLPLVADFIRATEVRESLKNVAPLIRSLIDQSCSVEEIITAVLDAEPSLCAHPLMAIILPHQSELLEKAKKIIKWSRETFSAHVLLAEGLLLTGDSFVMQELDLNGVFALVQQALDTGAELELDSFWTPNQVEEEKVESEIELKSSPQSASAVSEVPVTVHERITCDGCHTSPIKGIRFKCTRCPDFDLCEACEAEGTHPADHILMKIRVPVTCGRSFGPFRGFGRRQAAARRHPEALSADFVASKSVPDNADVLPSATLTKVWSVKNNGDRVWPSGTRLIFLSGEVKPLQGAEARLAVPLAAPGETVDVTVEVRMPQQPGHASGDFRLEAPTGKFGSRFWVNVNVVEPVKPVQPEVKAPVQPEVKAPVQPEVKAPVQPEVKAPVQPEVKAPAQPEVKVQAQPEVKVVPPEPEVKQVATTAPHVPADDFKYAKELSELSGMGFGDSEINKYLLLNNQGDLQRVVEWLLHNQL